jgi:hypothetical protein
MDSIVIPGRRVMARRLATVLVIAGLLIAAAVFPRSAAAGQEKESASQMVERAEGGTRTINTAEVTYASTYTTGFSRTLAELGGSENETPTASRAYLVDEELAAGKKSGYLFVYKPGPKDKDGKTNSFTLSVRPIKWRKGLKSIFSDETGVLHETTENRAATKKDPEFKE